MGVVIRSWNVFHFNTHPVVGGERAREMVELITEGDPDVVCLQELPAWALGRLEDWSGMRVVTSVARRPSLGPLPLTADMGRILNDLQRPLARGYFEGQANATLLGPRVRLEQARTLVLNDRRFRRAQARWLGLPPLTRLGWAREPRTCIATRLRLPDGRGAVVANAHATSFRADERVSDAEILRAAVFLDTLARPDDVCVLAGDLNVRFDDSRTLRELTGPEWGFDGHAPGVDHMLVRGATATPTRYWPRERRRLDGVLLSDHAPVERELT